VTTTALSAGLLVCTTCGLLHRRAQLPAECAATCTRCHSVLHWRKPNSIVRTWAFLIAGLILYIPANILPVMETGAIGGTQYDTILSGAVMLWVTGSWPLSVIVIVASIIVPVLKLLVISYLLTSVQTGNPGPLVRRVRLYRLVEFIGRWSMVDIYVGALLVSLLQFRAIATVFPGPGAIAFAGVVVLTMLASRSFDPRLIWDAGSAAEEPHG
jgi:paraquat-inducible protein A